MAAPDELDFEPISRETVSSQIRSQLLRRITTGDMPPGSRMPSERALSEQFHVARTSVREAIQGLVSLGVIERRGNRSYVAEHLPEVVMREPDSRKDFVVQLFETRRVLEVPIFMLAAERAGDGDKERVAGLAQRFGEDLDIAEFRRLDREFHTTVAASCGNPLLIELYGKVLDQLFRSSEFDALLSDELNKAEVARIVAQSCEAHARIAEAFVANDLEAMERHSRGHVSAVEQAMVDDLV